MNGAIKHFTKIILPEKISCAVSVLHHTWDLAGYNRHPLALMELTAGGSILTTTQRLETHILPCCGTYREGRGNRKEAMVGRCSVGKYHCLAGGWSCPNARTWGKCGHGEQRGPSPGVHDGIQVPATLQWEPRYWWTLGLWRACGRNADGRNAHYGDVLS